MTSCQVKWQCYYVFYSLNRFVQDVWHRRSTLVMQFSVRLEISNKCRCCRHSWEITGRKKRRPRDLRLPKPAPGSRLSVSRPRWDTRHPSLWGILQCDKRTWWRDEAGVHSRISQRASVNVAHVFPGLCIMCGKAMIINGTNWWYAKRWRRSHATRASEMLLP